MAKAGRFGRQTGAAGCGMPSAFTVAALALTLTVLMALDQSTAAKNIVSDLRLADGGNQRVLFTSSGSPAAIMVMFVGGEGTVEIRDSGTIGQYAGNFLLRTQPLWLEQGFGRNSCRT